MTTGRLYADVEYISSHNFFITQIYPCTVLFVLFFFFALVSGLFREYCLLLAFPPWSAVCGVTWTPPWGKCGPWDGARLFEVQQLLKINFKDLFVSFVFDHLTMMLQPLYTVNFFLQRLYIDVQMLSHKGFTIEHPLEFSWLKEIKQNKQNLEPWKLEPRSNWTLVPFYFYVPVFILVAWFHSEMTQRPWWISCKSCW